MAINIKCGECQSPYSVAENLLGKSIKCKNCGAMIPVAAPAAPVAAPVAKPIPAKPLPAKPMPAKAVLDDEDDDRPVRSRKSRDDDEDDDSPRGRRDKDEPKKKSSLPLVLGGLVGLVVLAGAAVGGLYAAGMLGEKEPPELTTTPSDVGPDSAKPQPVDPYTPPPEVKPKDPVISGPVSTPVLPIGPKPKSPPKTGISREQLMRGDMDERATELVTRATILVEGEGPSGDRWTGTAWFGIEDGLVFTNAHVLGMVAPGSKPPAKLTFHLYKPDSGASARIVYDRTIPHERIKILGVDRHNDLAVLKINNEANLPTPLKVRPSSELRPRQGMTVFGFPLSSTVAAVTDTNALKNIEMSVRATSVSAFRNDSLGRARFVQFEGSANPGNSGGPIVDAEGHVVCVVVAGIRNQDGTMSALSLAVPTEYAFGLLAGRIDDVEFETAYKADGGVRIPITAKCIDPMQRLQKVGLGYWVGDAKGEIRPPGEKKPETLPSDMEHKFVDLKYDPATKTAKGELVLPELTPGRSYWAQGFYTNALVPNGYWTPGTTVELNGPPVDRVPTDLIAKFPVGVIRPITLSNSNDISEFAEDEGQEKERRVKIATTIKMTEGIGAGNASQGVAATLGFKYQSLDLKAQVGNRELNVFPKRTLDELNQIVTKVEAQAQVNARGGIFNHATNTRGIPNPALASFVSSLSAQVLETLQVCSIELPNKKVNPLEKWEQKRVFRLYLASGTPGEIEGKAPGGAPPKPPTIRELKFEQVLTYTYMGTRQRLGTNEAVVRIDGVVNPAPGSREKASGDIKGYANIDLETGAVVLADIDSEFEVDSSTKGIKKKVSGISTYNLTRGSSVK